MSVTLSFARTVRQCNPDDQNYGGWDVLAHMPDGSWTCVAETQNETLAAQIASAVSIAVESVCTYEGISTKGWVAVDECGCVGLSHRDTCPKWVLPL